MPYGPLYCRSLHRKPLSKGGNRSRSFPESKRNLSDAVLYMLVRIIEIRAGDHTGELLAETFAYFYYIRTEIIPYPGYWLLNSGYSFADGCMPRKMYIATFVVRD